MIYIDSSETRIYYPVLWTLSVLYIVRFITNISSDSRMDDP